ncbi:unnamed protein product [Brassica oleracea]
MKSKGRTALPWMAKTRKCLNLLTDTRDTTGLHVIYCVYIGATSSDSFSNLCRS